MSTGNLLVVDLEATCDESESGRLPAEEMEIIEIGAVLLSADNVPLVEYQRFVRPVRHPRLTAFCRELTGIRQSDVDGALSFPEVADDLRAWLWPYRRHPLTWASWGNYDRYQLDQDCAWHGVANPLADVPHLNLKKAFQKVRGGKRRGLRGALADLGLEFDGEVHRGIDDARNIVRIVQHCPAMRDRLVVVPNQT